MTRYSLSDARKYGWLARDLPKEMANHPRTTNEATLTGTSFFAKDLFDIEGEATPAGCLALQQRPPAAKDAAIIHQLKLLGARLIGTSNMDSLAYGFITQNPLYGLAKNPLDTARICGGSSGGSAALVAAGLADFSLGTDTSGSIRVPAAFTGVFGIKPTKNQLSTDGAFPLSPTMDRVGLFAQNPTTLHRVFSALSPASTPTPENGIARLKIARLGGYFAHGLDYSIEAAISAFCAQNNIEEYVELTGSTQARAAAYLLVAAEAAAVHSQGLKAWPELFDQETRARLLAAQAIPPEWIDAARKEQRKYEIICMEAFKHADVLVAPCVPCIAPTVDALHKPTENNKPPLRASLGQYTQPISLAGLPVVAFPIPTPEGMPTAVQLIGRPGDDHKLLNLACSLYSQNKI